MSKKELIDKRMIMASNNAERLRELSEPWKDAIDSVFSDLSQFWYDSSTFMGYALLLVIKNYPYDLSFWVSVDDRLGLEEMNKKYKLRLIQEDHDDGSMTVRLVKTERDEDES